MDEPPIANFDQLQDGRSGYGGDGVLCVDDTGKKTVELFDLFEARILRGQSFSPASGDPYDVARSILDRVAMKEARLGAKLLSEFAELQASGRLIEVELKNVDDAGDVPFIPPENCAIVQAAIRTANPLPGDPKYLLDKRVWKLMDTRSQAALLLHEVIYKHAVSQGYDDSRTARLLNSHVHLDSFAPESVAEFSKLVLELVLHPSTYKLQHVSRTDLQYWSPWIPGGELGFDAAVAACAARPGFQMEVNIGLGRSEDRFNKGSDLGRSLYGIWHWTRRDPSFPGKGSIAVRRGSDLNGEAWDDTRDPATPLAYLCNNSF